MDFFLNIPMLSFLLLIAGILVGHMIWGRANGDRLAELIRLEQHNEQLRSQTKSLNQSIKEMQMVVDDHQRDQHQLKSAQSQLEHLRQQHKTLQHALKESEEQCKTAQHAHQQILKQVNESEDHREQLQSEAEGSRKEQAKSLHDLTNQRDLLKAECNAVQGENTELQKLLRTQEDELRILRSTELQFERDKSELQQLRELYESLSAENTQVRRQYEQLELVAQARADEVESLLEDIAKLEQFRSASQDVELTRASHQQLEQDFGKQQKELQSTNAKLATSESEKQRLVADVARLEAIERDHESQSRKLQWAIDDVVWLSDALQTSQAAEKQAREGSNQIREQYSQRSSEMETLRVRLEEKEQLLASMSAEVDELQHSLAACTQESEEQDADLASANKELSGLTALLSEQSNALQTSDDAQKRLLIELRELRTELTATSTAHSQVTEAADQLAEDLASARASIEELELRNREQESAIQDRSTDHQDLSDRLRSKTEELRASIVARDELSDRLRDVEDEVLDLRRQMLDSAQTLDQNEDEKEQSRIEIAKLQEKLNQAVERERGTQDQEDRRAELATSLHGQASHLVEQLYRIATSQFASPPQAMPVADAERCVDSALEGLRSDLSQLESRLGDLRERRSKDVERLHVLQTQYDTRLQDLFDATRDREDVTSQLKESEAQALVLKDHILQLEEVRSVDQADVHELQVMYKERVKELAEASDARRELVETNQNAENKITLLEVRIQQLEKVRIESDSALAKLRSQLAESESNTNRVAEQREQLEQAMAERDTLVHRNRELDVQLNQLEDELVEQKTSCRALEQRCRDLDSRLKFESERHDLATNELQQQKSRVVKLDEDLQGFRDVVSENGQLTKKLSNLQERLHKMTSERDLAVAMNRDFARRVAALQMGAAAGSASVQAMQKQRVDIIKELHSRAADNRDAA